MIADPRRKHKQDEGDGDKRRRHEEALDEALKDTFPASDPVFSRAADDDRARPSFLSPLNQERDAARVKPEEWDGAV
jgi:hypothetical protein